MTYEAAERSCEKVMGICDVLLRKTKPNQPMFTVIKAERTKALRSYAEICRNTAREEAGELESRIPPTPQP